MDGMLPIVILILLFFLFKKRIKIPKGLKPLPTIEIELPSNYEAVISLNQNELIRLPLSNNDIDDYKRHKSQLSKSTKILKYRQQGSSIHELLINVYGDLHLSEDSFTVDIAYKKISAGKTVRNFGEIDYALAYVDDGKLLLDSDIQEKNIKFDQDEGHISIQFEGLAEKVQKRIDAFS